MTWTFKCAQLGSRGGVLMAVGAFSLCFSFTSTLTSVGAAVPGIVVKRSAELQTSLRWIQPLLGQAIVEDAVIRQPPSRYGKAVDDVHHLSVVSNRTAGANSALWTSADHSAIETDHASRAQWIMGRLIVELTRHRMMVQPGRTDEGNQRIIAIARLVQEELNGAFRTGWHPGPGRAVATKALKRELTQVTDSQAGLVF
ncbi:MAG: hypothetical protein P0111_01090 [Nitrospira sp.]|nr:hypothetical protein [Nitrospira sp.]